MITAKEAAERLESLTTCYEELVDDIITDVIIPELAKVPSSRKCTLPTEEVNEYFIGRIGLNEAYRFLEGELNRRGFSCKWTTDMRSSFFTIEIPPQGE